MTPTGVKEAVVSSRSVPVTTTAGYHTRRNRTDIRLRNRLSIIHPPSVPKDSDQLLSDQEPISVPHPVTEPVNVQDSTLENEPALTITRSGRTVRPRQVLDL